MAPSSPTFTSASISFNDSSLSNVIVTSSDGVLDVAALSSADVYVGDILISKTTPINALDGHYIIQGTGSAGSITFEARENAVSANPAFITYEAAITKIVFEGVTYLPE